MNLVTKGVCLIGGKWTVGEMQKQRESCLGLFCGASLLSMLSVAWLTSSNKEYLLTEVELIGGGEAGCYVNTLARS